MRTCPYCGAPLHQDQGFYCPNCGGALHRGREKIPPRHAAKKKPKKRRKQKARRKPKPTVSSVEREDAYDGYYDDVLPTDGNPQRQGLDKGIGKKLIAVIVCTLLIVTICVAFLYYL